MKKIISLQAKKVFNRAALLISTLVLSCYVFAQEKKVDIDINTRTESESNFFTQPWVWVVGGAVFILLLVALLRGGSKDK